MGGTKLWAEPGELVSRHMGAWRDRQGTGPSQGPDQSRRGGVARSLTLGTRDGKYWVLYFPLLEHS